MYSTISLALSLRDVASGLTVTLQVACVPFGILHLIVVVPAFLRSSNLRLFEQKQCSDHLNNKNENKLLFHSAHSLKIILFTDSKCNTCLIKIYAIGKFLTVTLHWVLSPLYVFAVIVAVPVPTAVIFRYCLQLQPYSHLL